MVSSIYDFDKMQKLYVKHEKDPAKWHKIAKDMNLSNPDAVRKAYNRHFKMVHGSNSVDISMKDKVGLFLKQNTTKVTITELANRFNVSPQTIDNCLDGLKGDHFNIERVGEKVELSNTIQSGKSTVIDSTKFFKSNGKMIRFAAIGDTHLCSKYSREEELNTFYDICANEGINKVFLAGNMVDGERRFNKYDIHTTGAEGQIRYFVNNFPKRKGIETHFITGDDHEGWWTQDCGLDVGAKIQSDAEKIGRFDLKYLGHMEHVVKLKGVKQDSSINIVHAGGGSAYSVSYKSQKYAEAVEGGTKSTLNLIGHFHKFDWCYPRNMHMIQVGSFQSQTPFMRKKMLQSVIGGCIIEAHQDSDGAINRVKVEFVSFFDKGYYEYKWK